MRKFLAGRQLCKLLILSLAIGFTISSIAAQGPEGKPSAPMENKPNEEGKSSETKPAEEKKKEEPPPEPTYPDPSGANSGVLFSPSVKPENLKLADVHANVVHNGISINMMWILLAGFLVMFMQAGFALVETGLCRSKNAAHVMGMNFMIYPLACLSFFIYGFAIGWGNWYNAPVASGWYATMGDGTKLLDGGFGLGPEYDENGKPKGTYKYQLIGTKGFFLSNMEDVGIVTLFFFMMVFFDTTATIPTGVLAERWAWKNFILFGLWVALPYCLFGGWVWGGGWLAQSGNNWGLGHGAVDFAGSGVVHLMGGAIGLAGVLLLGPRIGKFDAQGRPQALPGHNIPFVVVGTFVLAFGWFGFNGGSTLAGTDLRIGVVVVNTMLGGVSGAFATMLTLYAKGIKPDPSMMCNGMLAGLVAITAPCAFVSPWAAVVIGLIAGILVVFSVFFFEDVGIDDPVGALSVHGVNGFWGVVAVGIFANGKYGGGWNGVNRPEFAQKDAKGEIIADTDCVRGLLYGDASQLGAQLLEGVVCLVVGFVTAFVMFALSDKITPMRAPADQEQAGLDIHELGAVAYPDALGGRR